MAPGALHRAGEVQESMVARFYNQNNFLCEYYLTLQCSFLNPI